MLGHRPDLAEVIGGAVAPYLLLGILLLPSSIRRT